MAGHSKWAQIKRQKGTEDARRSKVFSKLSRLITSESKRVGGKTDSPSLRTIIEKAKKENMPKDTIDRAVKKGVSEEAGEMFEILYEAYGPGGTAILIECLTDSKNRTSQEIKHALSEDGGSLAGPGAASWAFTKRTGEYLPQTTVPLTDEDGAKLSVLMEKLEERDDVQAVYTNAD
ncbi:MAG: YebC/PmpR family DNA-binding transcriptional regulator [Patescibacteria group bacterium]